MKRAIIVASGKSGTEIKKYENNFDYIIVINNAWATTKKWKYWIHPNDYKGSKPEIINPDQKEINANGYGPSLRKYGGIHECGFSITLNASYWVLDNLKPDEIYYLGADMNYEPDKEGNTHFYGVGIDIKNKGISDPDLMVKVRSKGDANYLENIYKRFEKIAKENNCMVFNLSKEENSRLPFPKKEKLEEKPDTIFIQIASYRDPQLIPTIDDCLKNAKFPENLRFCIAWQHDEKENLDKYLEDSRFTILDIPYHESKGACWARNKIQEHYKGEKYTLQLDSHHRFSKDWDEQLIKMITDLQKDGYKKPLLTGYISSFDPENDPEKRVMTPWKMDFDRFIPEGAVFFLPASIERFAELEKPIRARFYSAHFCFTLGQFCVEVPHDPNYYFHGEEISIAVRAFTWGYDLFHPHKVVAWHEYTRKGRTKQWDDDKEWHKKNSSCHLRNRKLFEMDGEKKDIDFGIYDFGKIRSLREYEEYAGINFKKRAAQKYTLDRLDPPNPKFKNEEEYNKSFIPIFKHCIDFYTNQVKEDDWDFWVVAFEDEKGNTIFRKDADAQEISRILKTKTDIGYVKIWREFASETVPHKWVVWLHSTSGGWKERVSEIINK
jgi:hypothetical protein